MPRGLASPLPSLVAFDRYLLRQGRWLRTRIFDVSAMAVRLLPCLALAIGVATDTPGSSSSDPISAASVWTAAAAQLMASTFADASDLSDDAGPGERTGDPAAVERSSPGDNDTGTSPSQAADGADSHPDQPIATGQPADPSGVVSLNPGGSGDGSGQAQPSGDAGPVGTPSDGGSALFVPDSATAGAANLAALDAQALVRGAAAAGDAPAPGGNELGARDPAAPDGASGAGTFSPTQGGNSSDSAGVPGFPGGVPLLTAAIPVNASTSGTNASTGAAGTGGTSSTANAATGGGSSTGTGNTPATETDPPSASGTPAITLVSAGTGTPSSSSSGTPGGSSMLIPEPSNSDPATGSSATPTVATPSQGVSSPIVTTPGSSDNPVELPEPGSLVLLLTMGAGLWLGRRSQACKQPAARFA